MDDSYRNEIAKLEALYASNPGGRVFVHLAEALRRAGDQERARGILEEGLARHPDSASGFVVLGRVLTNLGDGAGAEAAFNRVLQLDGGNLVALRGLGDLALETGRPDEAARHYRELVSRSPYNDEVQALLAQIESGGAEVTGVAGSPDPEPVNALDQTVGATAIGTDAGMGGAEDDAEGQEAADGAPDDVVAAPDLAGGLSGDADAPDVFHPAETAAHDPLEQPVEAASAAPGDVGDTASSETEFGMVDIDSLPGDLATFAGLADEDEPDDAADMPAPQALEDLTWDEPEQPEIAAMWEEAQAGPTPATEDGGSLDTSGLQPDLNIEIPGDLENAGSEPAEVETVHLETDSIGPDDDAGAVATEEEADEAPEQADAADAYEEATSTGWDGMPDIPVAAEDPAEDMEAAAGSAPEWPLQEVVQEAREDEHVGAGAEELPAGGDQLETETMADLYRSQGLLDRAAGVYRALLRRRPDDGALAAKLDATEAELAASIPADDEAGEGWLRGTGTAWTEAPEPREGDESESPYAWTEAGEEPTEDALAPAGPAIGEYLHQLVSWQRPGQAPTHPPAAAGTQELDSSSEGGEGEAPSEPAAADAPLTNEPDFMAEEPWLQGTGEASGQPDEAAGPAPDAGEPNPPSDPWAAPDPWADQAEPWADTSSDQSEAADPWASSASAPPEQAPRASQPADPVEDAFDEWFSNPAGENAETAAAGAEPADDEPAAEEPAGVAESRGETASDAPAAEAESGSRSLSTDDGGEEDEDLAMFRSWLQSLKK